jgi:hypothetical protein
MYAGRGQTTPCHSHGKKKEDIVCRAGELMLRFWPTKPDRVTMGDVSCHVPIDGVAVPMVAGEPFLLRAGSRATITPNLWHEFFPASDECIIGEISTVNDDLHDNHFLRRDMERFPRIEEDEVSLVTLVGEKSSELREIGDGRPAGSGLDGKKNVLYLIRDRPQ